MTAVFCYFGGNSGNMVIAKEPNQQKQTSPGASEVCVFPLRLIQIELDSSEHLTDYLPALL